jgi:cyclopropane fatty-acyl-phospholipid synthase-like methyltransferase
MGDANQKRFNEIASTWDENPFRQKLAQDVSDSILASVELHSDMRLLDYGCGTGLVTFHLLSHVAEAVGADSSSGMIDIFQQKVAAYGVQNATGRLLASSERIGSGYDLIVSSMVFHHVERPVELLKTFYTALNRGGFVCVADLDSEDGLFHGGENAGIYHFGFERDRMESWFEEAGFLDVRSRLAATAIRENEMGVKRDYTIFLCTGRKA